MQKHLTICQLGRMGDITASEPIYRHLRKQYPAHIIQWYTREEYIDILKFSSLVDQIITVNNAAEYLDKKKGFSPDTLSYEINFGTQNKIGFDLSNSLLDRFSAQIGIFPQDMTPIWHSNPAIRNDITGKYAVIHCSSNGRSRQWPAKNWDVIAEQCLNAGFQVIEIGIHKRIHKTHKNLISLTGKLDLQYAAKIIADASFFLGVDSGFGHIANAVGTYGLIICGSLRSCPAYNPYSGRYAHTNCNLLRFYDVPADQLPLYIVQHATECILKNRPMSYQEAERYCLLEQVKLLQNNIPHRIKRFLSNPFHKLKQSIDFHYIRH